MKRGNENGDDDVLKFVHRSTYLINTLNITRYSQNINNCEMQAV